jgi:hypothetical protein
MSIILETQKAEIRRIVVQAQENGSRDRIWKKNITRKGLVELVERLKV